MKTLKQRLKERVVKNNITGCHEWQGAKAGAGYGYFTLWPEKKNIYVHRAVYEEEYGEIGNMLVLHKCDNPACCNPTHLFLGTQSDNMRDMHKKNRQPLHMRREGQPRRKLTDEQAQEIRLSKKSHRALGKEYGVHHSCIYYIKIGKTY